MRGDYNQSQKLQWAFRFSNGVETVSIRASRHWARLPEQHRHQLLPIHGLQHLDHLATLVNFLTLGYTDFYNSIGTLSQNKVDAVALINAGIPNLEPGAPATWGIPSFSFTPIPLRQLATAPTALCYQQPR